MVCFGLNKLRFRFEFLWFVVLKVSIKNVEKDLMNGGGIKPSYFKIYIFKPVTGDSFVPNNKHKPSTKETSADINSKFRKVTDGDANRRILLIRQCCRTHWQMTIKGPEVWRAAMFEAVSTAKPGSPGRILYCPSILESWTNPWKNSKL